MFPSQDDLYEVLFDENAARSYLVEKGIIALTRLCESCGDQGHLCLGREVYTHNCKGKTKRVSIWKGTFFAKSKLKPSLILRLAHFWIVGVSHTQLMMLTNCARQTITDFFSFFNQVVSEDLDETFEKIGGANVIVEVDEIKVAKRKYNRGHRVEGAWCVVGVERTEQRRLFIVEVESRDEETIRDIIEHYIIEGSIIYTDCWRGYLFLDRDENSLFSHQSVNHRVNFKDPVTQVHTNTVEGTNSAIKAKISKRYRTKGALTPHLHTFIWKRLHENGLWGALIDALKKPNYE
jgi:transposase-like protein